MISPTPHILETGQDSCWQDSFADAITDLQTLFSELNLDPSLLGRRCIQDIEFSLKVPRSYVARMSKGNPDDPLLLQVLPLIEERQPSPGYSRDPLQEARHQPLPGLLHKYEGRVLIVTTGACAIHCRYCFRRHFPYAASNPLAHQWHPILAYIHHDNSIEEVILSGGDPLLLGDRKLEQLVGDIAEIAHVQILRIHTRMPVVLPERVDNALIGWLSATRLKVVIVLHANHANELDGAVEIACQRLRASVSTLLNQSVLLKGINDNAATLAQLSKRLFTCGVMPYYLHLLDHVAGAAHFEVGQKDAAVILHELHSRLPGYLVPRLALETPGEPYKLQLPAWIQSGG